eukprot:1319137-Rhodomonas_salina.1
MVRMLLRFAICELRISPVRATSSTPSCFSTFPSVTATRFTSALSACVPPYARSVPAWRSNVRARSTEYGVPPYARSIPGMA